MTDGTASAATQSMLQDVTIVIVTFNSAHCLPKLGRLLASCPNIIVVDNGSDDGCVNVATQHLPRAKVIARPINLGFGAANNRALAQVKTPFALLLNPDCEISATAIQQLLITAKQWPQAAMVAPQLLKSGGEPDVNYRWPHLLWKSRGPAATEGPACVGFVCGAAMLMRMSAFGGQFFDEQFFLYYEDDDLCTRLFNQRQAMVIDPTATAIHRSRDSVKGKHPLRSEYIRGYHHAQSKLTYTAKHAQVATAHRLRTRLIWQTLLALPLRVVLFSPKLIARMCGRCLGLSRWSIKGLR